MEEMAQLYDDLEETFRGIKIVKAFTMERQERRRFHANSKQYYKKADADRRATTPCPIRSPKCMGILTICLALLAGAYLVLQGETHLLGNPHERPAAEPARRCCCSTASWPARPTRPESSPTSSPDCSGPPRPAIGSTPCSTASRRSATRSDPVALARHHSDLVFDGVDFAYPPGPARAARTSTCESPSARRSPSSGPNGCGKSTLANLIPRFADPDRRDIRLDGVPLGDVRLRDLRSQIGLVTQEPLLFDDTVFNNIRYGSPQATPEEVDPGGPAGPRPPVHRAGACPTATRRSSARWAGGSPAASGSGSPWPGRSSATRPSSSSTRPPARSTWRASS